MDKFVTRKEVLKILKIHYHTLYSMVKRGEIETLEIGKRNLYNLDKFLRDKGVTNKKKQKICYCRVSSNKQKEDLERQVNFMKEKYPDYEIIKDIGSGLNFKRRGLNKIIEIAINGELEELLITYKDRLCRIGFELIENIIKKYSNGKITIVNKSEEETPTEEVTKDIISIMNIYVAKINGLRKYKTDIKKTIKNNKKE
jgi:predicted site-specific integrase-resolvase|tara:strand:- start:129 stop:725 length:597 start_codon:yes stop_codon:yes gene_type:complete